MGIHQGGCLPCSAAGELQPFFALSLGPQQIHCRCHHNHFLSSLVSPFLPQALLLLVYPPNPNKGDLVKVEVRAWPCSATSLPPSYFAQNKSWIPRVKKRPGSGAAASCEWGLNPQHYRIDHTRENTLKSYNDLEESSPKRIPVKSHLISGSSHPPSIPLCQHSNFLDGWSCSHLWTVSNATDCPFCLEFWPHGYPHNVFLYLLLVSSLMISLWGRHPWPLTKRIISAKPLTRPWL